MKPRILVVDDEKNIRRSMQMILSSEGYPVRLAENAREALGLLKKEAPEIIFLDVMLPVVTSSPNKIGLSRGGNYHDIRTC